MSVPSTRVTRSTSRAAMSSLRNHSTNAEIQAGKQQVNPKGSVRQLSTQTSKATERRSSSNPKKRRKTSSGYAPPSKYAHLKNNLSDALRSDLICVFIGLNPGLRTATTGHAYAHPSNLFWKLLHSSGCTPRRCSPSETYDLPLMYGLGNTNIVKRPTANGAELSKAEMDAGVAVLDEKIRQYRPEAVVIVGKSIWESIWRVWRGRSIEKDEFKYGWQDEHLRMGKPTLKLDGHAGAWNKIITDDHNLTGMKQTRRKKNSEGHAWKGARVFVATSTSGLAASMSPAEKQAVWRQLGEWVERKRQEKGLTGNRYAKDGQLNHL